VLQCIESLKNQDLEPSEIILVLDPREGLRDYYRSRMPKGVVIATSNSSGLSNARNVGVRATSGDIVAFIDDDAEADTNWLSAMVPNFENPTVFGVGGMAQPKWEDKRPLWFPEELDWIVGCTYQGFPKTRRSVRNPIGCNMAFRRSAFERVGLFNPGLGRVGRILRASEEAEFSIRLLNTIPQSRIVYDPTSVVYHKVMNSRTSVFYLLRRAFYEGISKRMLQSHHSEEKDLLSVEREYLNFLLKTAIPARIRRIKEFANLTRLFCIIVCIAFVLVGYFSETVVMLGREPKK
jgi:cellulose synthase/poly-beta-1,6-N-acetylglucosamine synthase-like glycosyltransferase